MQNAYMEIIPSPTQGSEPRHKAQGARRTSQGTSVGDTEFASRRSEIELAVQFHVLLTFKTEHWI